MLPVCLVGFNTDAALRQMWILDFFLHLVSKLNPTSADMVGITTMYETEHYMDSDEIHQCAPLRVLLNVSLIVFSLD